MTEWILLVTALLLILGCGVFVAAEFAFVTVDRSKVDQAAATGDPGAVGIQLALRSLSTQLSGAQVGITVTNLAIGYLAEPAIAQLIDGPLIAAGLPDGLVTPVAVTIALTLSTALTMIFGELVPKNLAIARADGDGAGDPAVPADLHADQRAPDPAPEQLGQRRCPPARDRAAGGAAVGAELHRAGLPGRSGRPTSAPSTSRPPS